MPQSFMGNFAHYFKLSVEFEHYPIWNEIHDACGFTHSFHIRKMTVINFTSKHMEMVLNRQSIQGKML
jgi:hypothetical protein